MAELSRYEVEVNGVVTTLRLSDEDAKKRGLSKPAKAESKPRTAEKK